MFINNSDLFSVKIPNFIDDFRPYNESEAAEAYKRIAESNLFFKIMKYFFPNETTENQKKRLLEIKSIKEFQLNIFYRTVTQIINSSISNLTLSGVENLDKNKNYVFISNHRDIILDATLFLYKLVEHDFDSSEITFGDNLMTDRLIIDIGKINKMFKVYRSGKPKELMTKTAQLSEYIRYTILQKKQSVWIAQRGGRTKDGNDMTQSSVIKMLNSSGTKSFEENLQEINIVPLSISYQFEPCDYLKVQELYNTVDGKYSKQKNEDINSIINGVTKNKGNVHIQIGKVISAEFIETQNENRLNAKAEILSKLIDKQVYNNYKLWNTNFIATDILRENKKYSNKYSIIEKEEFEKYIENQCKKINGNHETLKQLLLKIYANPVINFESSI
jgi:hypothetical protein